MRKFRTILSLLIVFILAGCSITIESTTSNDVLTSQPGAVTTAEPEVIHLEHDLKIHFIDVGQADSIFFILPNGETMIIDGGNNADGPLVVDYLKNQGVTRLDYVVGTHPHEDHIGGLDNVINAFDIGKVYLPNKTSTTVTYIDLINVINAKNIPVVTAKAGVLMFEETINNQILKAIMYAPVNDNYSEVNNFSAVIKLTYGSTTYLFTGDAEVDSENDIIASGVELKSNVLKVGHHGSRTSTSQAYLDLVKPEVAVISVGTGNTYGHPTPETIQRLEDNDIAIYRTDLLGSIVLTSNGTEIIINDQPINFEPSIVETPIAPTLMNKVFINEILVDPSTGSEEWIELYNATTNPIDISGLIIDGGGSTVTIPANTVIEANGYFVQNLDSSLDKSGSTVRLLSSEQVIIDSYTYTTSSVDMTWYRITDGGDWATAQTENPTPNTTNLPITVVINEILANPNTGSSEWVELYNTTYEAINISGYIIDDIANGGSQPVTIPSGTIIQPKRFYVYTFSSQILNNTGDDVILSNATGIQIDKTTFGTTTKEQSFYRIIDGGDWATSTASIPTPGVSNN